MRHPDHLTQLTAFLPLSLVTLFMKVSVFEMHNQVLTVRDPKLSVSQWRSFYWALTKAQRLENMLISN